MSPAHPDPADIPASTPGTALVVGVTGIVGQAVARRLLADGWHVLGLSRSGGVPHPDVVPVRADLADPASLRTALSKALEGASPHLVAFTAWTRRATEAENIAVNGAAVRDLLAALPPVADRRHLALMTGLKHYLGPFEAYGQGALPDTPFREESPRLDAPNFYYAQEDELFAAAAAQGATWSVHRSHTVFGVATGNAMNMVATLGAYATLCRELGRPMVFPGSRTQWEGLTDVTDADLLAEQMTWAAEHGHDEAFNTANGDVFRWRWLWPQLAARFDLPWEGFEDRVRPLEEQMTGTEELWTRIAAREGLVEPDLARVASWWHTDADLGREMEVVTDMNKSRAAGFTATRDTRATLFAHLDAYRAARVLP